MRFRVVRALWVGGVAALAIQWIAAERGRIDASAADRYGRDVRSVQALDARLNEQVMQSRQSLVTHYDDIVATASALDRTHRTLATPPGFLPKAEAGRLRSAVESSRAALAAKAERVERFKSENAVLRNSARYFPVAAQELRDRLASAGQAEASARVNELLLSVLNGIQLPSDRQREQAQAAERALSVLSAPHGFERDIEVVLLHARALIERGPRVAELTNDILEEPTRARADELDVAYETAVHAASEDAGRRNLAMVATVLAVVGFLSADWIQRYRRAARAERDFADKLSAANTLLLRDKEREKELADLKTRFVSMTSHEFRTPLAVILSSTELLEAYGDRWTPAKKSDHFARVKSAVGTMKGLLDAVLVIGKSDAGKLEFSPSPLVVDRFVREATAAFAATIGEKHPLRVEIEPDLPEAFADEKLLAHVLSNLLSNAVKYSPAGGPVDVSARRDDDCLVLEVRDRGIGIGEADRARLFESFHRGSNVGDIPGTGLGLAVVERAAVAHGGSVDLRSNGGEGTTFVVRLRAFTDPQREAVAPTG